MTSTPQDPQPPLILHHYALSPFSEKIRSMLGYAGLDWQSALAPAMPPRPVLAQLTGGYRKMPVAQVGADIFCDSKIIAAEIAARAERPELALEHCPPEAQEYIASVDLTIFFAALLGGRPGGLNRELLKGFSPLATWRFIRDRAAIGRRAAVRPIAFREAKPKLLDHLQGLNQRLAQQPFVFGTSPNHADFSTYHSLWILRDVLLSRQIARFPFVLSWMDRMRAFGHGQRQEIDPAAALAAAECAPRPLPEASQDHPDIGSTVRIAPADYARDPTLGELAGHGPDRWILRRIDPQLGELHVHFPTSGYTLRKQ